MSPNRAAAWAPLVRPSFLICVAVLGVAAVIAGPVAGRLSAALIKEPIYCREPLHKMRKDALGPYKFIRAIRLNAAFIASLGTDRYLDWVVEDTRERPNSPLRCASVFITYHTGTANLVPHTPDVCYVGGGYAPKQPHGSTTVEVPALAPGETEVPIRVCTFVKSQVFNRDEPTVVYTFHCNGRFAASRTTVRRLINNPLAKHAYFSKVEVSFFGRSPASRKPTREQSVEAARELFRYLLPVLVNEHYPDWIEVESKQWPRPNDSTRTS